MSPSHSSAEQVVSDSILSMVRFVVLAQGESQRESHVVERPWNSPSSDLLSYAAAGRTHIQLEGRDEPIWLDEGSCVFLPAERRRRAVMYPRDGLCLREHLQFRFELERRVNFLAFFELPMLHKGEAAQRLRASLRDIRRLADDRECAPLPRAIELRALSSRLLADLLRGVSARPDWTRFLQHYGRLQPALACIDANWRGELSLDDLAASANTSVPTLCRLFRQTLDQSPQDYLRERRMREARRLLLTGDASLAEVANELGYSDAFTFSRAFKRVCGMPPSQFRASGFDVL